jgi:uncharacterized protein (DUF1684 family)
MSCRIALIAVLLAALAGCSRDQGPDLPPVEQAQYQGDHQAWRAEQREVLRSVLPIRGIWPLPEGRAEAGKLAGGSVELVEISIGDDRQFVMAVDRSHPAATNPPDVESYPLDPRWRVAAQFTPYEQVKRVRVPDVRGGVMEFTAVGTLSFRLHGQPMQLTAFGEPDSPEFFVMFKDPTNQSTTYRGYRILLPKVVQAGEWTVLDFNFAMNPPCAYSPYTTCPLPPPENRLPVAVEAGLKRLPSAQGYTPAS